MAQNNRQYPPQNMPFNNGMVPNNAPYNQLPLNNNAPYFYGNNGMQNGPANRNGVPKNSNSFDNRSAQIVRVPARRYLRLYAEPLGVTLNPLSVGPSLTVGGTLSYFVASTFSVDVLAIVPVFGGSDSYTKTLYGVGLGKNFANGSVFRIGGGYKATTELRKYDRVIDKLTEASLPAGQKANFSNCPNPGLEDLSSGKNTVTYVNCSALIMSSYIGLYASLGLQMTENENFGIHLRLFTLFYPIPFVGKAPVYDVRDPKEKGVLTPRDLFDVSSLGMSVTFAL